MFLYPWDLKIMKELILILVLLFPLVAAAQPMEYAVETPFASSAFDGERNYYLALPASYAKDSDRTYPVMFVLHGQWDMLATIAALDVIADDIPELIIVGVNSRGLELRPANLESDSPNQEAIKFQQYLYQELIPEIKGKYRIAGFSILSGHSNSGRFALNSFLDHAEYFSAYFTFSPSLDDGEINRRFKSHALSDADKNTHLVMTLANEGEHMQQPYAELVALLEKSGLKDFQHREFPEQTHQSSKIVSQMYALKALFAGWNPSREVQLEGLDSLVNHYEQLSEKYGFEVTVPIDRVVRLTGHFSMSEEAADQQMAGKLIAWGINQNADYIEEFLSLAEYFGNNDMPAQALFVKSETCKLAADRPQCQIDQSSEPD